MGAPRATDPEFVTKENYGRWKIRMKNYLVGKELWDIVEGTEPKPDQATQVAEFRTWRKKNGKALYAIQASCGPEVFDIISEMDSAKDTWDAILDFMNQQPTIEEEAEEEPNEEPTEAYDSSSLSTPGRSNEDNSWHLQLHEAVVKGDLNRTQSLITSHPEALSARLSMEETILHTAVLHDHVHIVVELLKKMSKEDTEITLPYRRNCTALHLAASRGIVKIAEVLVQKNANLLCLRDKKDCLPVTRASLIGNKDMMRYLYLVTPEKEINHTADGVRLLIETIKAEDYDFALEIHRLKPNLTFARNLKDFTPIQALAERQFSFPSGNRFKLWQRWIYNWINVHQSHADNSEGSVQTKVANWLKKLCWDAAKIFGIEEIYNTKLKNMQALELLKSMSSQVSTLNASEIKESKLLDAMASASEFGVVEFVVNMVKSNPTLLWMSAQFPRSIFHVAVEYRRDKIWNLIYGLGIQGVEFATFLQGSNGNTLLHEAAKLAPSRRLNIVSGPAMQMQREIQWFKEVETIVPPSLKGRVNKARKSARTLFTEQHKDLVKEAEKWMKDTATSCMLVATLIATVMFAAAFTLPGGNDSRGIPMYLQENSFMVFIVADALSLFSSTASILMFLSILTSRYAEEDFLKSLPKRLIIGFATLFFSIATMMVTFSATLFIVIHDRYKWVVFPISLLASVPIILFALLQLPLLVDMVLSTYGPSIFQKKTELLFSNSVPVQSTQTRYLGP